MKERTRARGWALQALYAWESRSGEAHALVPALQALFSELRVSPRNRPFADVLVRLVASNLEQIDALVERHLTNWTLRRLSVIDRNILRLATAELLFVDDAPPGITIREAIRLAEKYSTPESPRFVNGVLDAIMRSTRPADVPEAR